MFQLQLHFSDTYEEALTNLNHVILSHYESDNGSLQRFTKIEFDKEISIRKKRDSKRNIITGRKGQYKIHQKQPIIYVILIIF